MSRTVIRSLAASMVTWPKNWRLADGGWLGVDGTLWKRSCGPKVGSSALGPLSAPEIDALVAAGYQPIPGPFLTTPP